MDRKLLESMQQDANREMALSYKTASGQLLSNSEINELEQIARRKQDRLNDRRMLLEAPYAHLPALPPPLFNSLHIFTAVFEPLEKKFFTSCTNGEMDAVEGYIEAQGDRVARYLLQKGAQLCGLAIEYACRRCDLALFEFFLEHGWHPNQQIPSFHGHFGVALPHCTRDVRIVQLLLAHGADPNLGPYDFRKLSDLGSAPPMDRRSGHALTEAARSGSIEVVDLLLKHGAVLEWATPLHSALISWPHNRQAFVHFLHIGADPNKNIRIAYGTQWEGGTPLFQAIRFHNWDAVELLLESGADPTNLYPCVTRMDNERMNQGKPLMETFMALIDKVKQKKNDFS
ncbi:ankyrin repeat-containing domain protein [Xylaria sp. FL1777]|nr:ankyrin repeat-containing domain protein [Xylaria sp. FL1777]